MQGCWHRRTSLQYELWAAASINRSGRGYCYSVRSVLIFHGGKARECLDHSNHLALIPEFTRSTLRLCAWCTANSKLSARTTLWEAFWVSPNPWAAFLGSESIIKLNNHCAARVRNFALAPFISKWQSQSLCFLFYSKICYVSRHNTKKSMRTYILEWECNS